MIRRKHRSHAIYSVQLTSLLIALQVSPDNSKHFLTGASNSYVATVFHVSKGEGNVIISSLIETSLTSAGMEILLAARTGKLPDSFAVRRPFCSHMTENRDTNAPLFLTRIEPGRRS